MRDPRAVEAVAGLAHLVLTHLRERPLVQVRVAAAGDEGGHPAHRVRAAAVAGLHQELRVRAHERRGHGHGVAVGEDELGPLAEGLDHAEQVVPAPRVQARGVVAQLPENLVHLEGGQDRLDQDGGLDRPVRKGERLFGEGEDVVPEPRLEVALELGEVEVRPGAAVEQPAAVVEEVQAEVEERACEGAVVDLDMSFREMQPARPDEERRDLVLQPVLLLRGDELDPPIDRVDQVRLPFDQVRPGRRVRVLEVRHEHARARVEGVDHHLPVGRARDLDAPVP